jgi:hypothetical protein
MIEHSMFCCCAYKADALTFEHNITECRNQRYTLEMVLKTSLGKKSIGTQTEFFSSRIPGTHQ